MTDSPTNSVPLAANARQEVRRTLTLAVPATATQVGYMMLTAVDTMMMGRVNVDALGAVSLGHLWVTGTYVWGYGLLLGVDPIISQAHGAGDVRRVAYTLQRALVLALAICVPMAALWYWSEAALTTLGQRTDLAVMASGYLRIQIVSLPPFFCFLALRHYLQNRGIVFPVMWLMIAANGFNALFNWVLIFGKLGFPPMGVEGAAISTALTRYLLCASLIAWIRIRNLHADGWVPPSRETWRLSGFLQILKYGVPTSFHFGFEVWAFTIGSLLAGALGKDPFAAHTVVLITASMSFMFPLGMSIAATTRVGNLFGAGRPLDAVRAAKIALLLGCAVMFCFGMLFVSLPETIVGLYGVKNRVAQMAIATLPLAAAFQLFDGAQIVSAGILRGLGQTVRPAVVTLIGHYVIALPLGWWLSRSIGIRGIWIGFATGLATVALLLLALVWRAAKKLQRG